MTVTRKTIGIIVQKHVTKRTRIRMGFITCQGEEDVSTIIFGVVSCLVLGVFVVAEGAQEDDEWSLVLRRRGEGGQQSTNGSEVEEVSFMVGSVVRNTLLCSPSEWIIIIRIIKQNAINFCF